VIHVADERLVRLIALGKKTTHRFPANYKARTLEVTHPKISEGNIHKVYTRAPFGKDGDPDAEPLLEVMVDSVELEPLGDMTNEDARNEGFASLETFITYWNKVWFNKALKYQNNMYHPVWIIAFEHRKTLPAGDRLIKRIESKLKSKIKSTG
jgi:hypothetical protein